METRQYIGARYTPKFSGTIDPTQAYEALEVVDNGSGTTYIARKPVPPGIPLTNTEYWLVYGSSSGAILDLQTRVGTIENTDLPAINQDISNINGSILTMGGQISETESDISNIDVRVTRLERSEVNPDMRLIVYSDSYGQTRSGVVPFADRMQSELGLSNANFFNLSQGSMGVNPNSVITGGLSAFIDSSYSLVTNPETITDVLIAMGANDIGNITDIQDSFATCISKIRNKYPSAKIHIAFIGTTHAQTISNKNACYEEYKKASYRNKCYFIENSDIIMRDNTNLQSDNVHPNEAGAIALTLGLSFGVVNGYLEYKNTITAHASIGTASVRVTYEIFNDTVAVTVGELSLYGGLTIPSSDYKAFTIDNPAIRGSGAFFFGITAGGSATYGALIGCIVNNKSLYLRSYPALSNATAMIVSQGICNLRTCN